MRIVQREIVVYDVPIPVRGAGKIEGLILEFKHGKVVKYSAKTGIDAFENYLKSSQGDVNKFGFFGMGLNHGLKPGFTQDDKVLGGVTIGIGGNEDKMGKNRTEENRHWWASMTQATVGEEGRDVVIITKKDGRRFILTVYKDVHYLFQMNLYGTRGWREVRVEDSDYFYSNMLRAFLKMAETKQPPSRRRRRWK